MFTKKNTFKSFFILVFFAFLFISPQIFQRSLIVANDWLFHMNRYYDTSMQIQSGHFNYFQSLFGFNQSGRIINALYGADFAYVAGFLLSLVKNWFHFELLLNFICFFTAGFTMYLLARYAKLQNKVALFCAILYMGTPLIVWWTTTQGFSGFGSAFLPLAFIPAVKMIRDPDDPIHPLFFGSTFALLISIHMFTTFLAFLAIVPFYVIAFFNSKNKKKMLLNTFYSVLLAVCLSMNTFAAILDLHSDTLIMPLDARNLYNGGMFLSLGSMNYNNFGLILSAIFLIQLVVTVSNWRSLLLLEKLVNVIGLLFLLISSKYFPWNHLTEYFPSLLSIQFLRRFSGITCVLLILGFGFSIKHLYSAFSISTVKKGLIMTLSVIALFNTTNGLQLIDKQAKIWDSKNPLSGDTSAARPIESDPKIIREGLSSSNLSRAFEISEKPTPDYLPTNTNLKDGYATYYNEILQNKLDVKKEVTSDSKLKLTWNDKDNPKEEVLVPVIIYNNSTIELNGEKLQKKDYKLSEIGSLILKNNHQENQLIVGYSPSKFFQISLYIKALSLMYVFVCLLYKMKKKLK
ncbi:hypothetical protein ACFC6Q_04405 [Enterococcus gallinarum]|uniref:hypothetical protein n=1 Tax=Enterococcus gallinarum TaxID=1353 RepID=UPI001AD6247C|nr:hypothetical protein [Enterococcus gallinarum]MBO6326289.1 hypothetical protein [Enterococcus gallinarum]